MLQQSILFLLVLWLCPNGTVSTDMLVVIGLLLPHKALSTIAPVSSPMGDHAIHAPLEENLTGVRRLYSTSQDPREICVNGNQLKHKLFRLRNTLK